MNSKTYRNSISSRLFNKGWRITKRCFDLFISLTCLLLFSPLILLMAILIRIDSPGNPFFIQKRVGRDGSYFHIFKMRTLYLEHFGIFPGEEEPDEFRITPIGKHLRLSKLDELPQLLNVLLGDMSIVGPRPDIPMQADNYSFSQYQRLCIKPGITGIAQISGNTLLTWNDRIILDNWYIENWSLLLDFRIIALTVLSIIKRKKYNTDPFLLHGLLPDKNSALVS